MPGVKSTSVSWEMEFLGEPLAELSDDHLPTLGELLRLYYHHRKASPQNEKNRKIGLIVVKKCIEVWDKFEIPTVLPHNLTKIFVKLINLFTRVPYGSVEGSSARRRKELLWRKKLSLVFNAAAKDAVKGCNWKNKRLLETIKKEAKEFEQIERSISTKGKFNEKEVIAALGIKEVIEQQVTSKRKAESAQNEKHAAKRRKVSPEPEAVTRAVTTSDDLKVPKLEPFCGSTDLRLSSAEIVRSALPSVIVKEEINLEWDENDNVPLTKYQMAMYLVEYAVRGKK